MEAAKEDYTLPADMRKAMESLPIPAAIYRFANSRVLTVAVSKGFLDLFNARSAEEACRLMDTDMYRDTHPDDVARVADIAYRFATEGGEYEAVYRSKTAADPENYHLIHSTGRHIFTPDGRRLAVVWYLDETATLESDTSRCAEQLMSVLRNNVEVQTGIRKNNYDDLTGLPNMTYFLQLAGEERREMLDRGEVPAILFLDLNGFKYYNHQNGFAQGDRLIRTLGLVIRKYFGAEYAGRLFADHFAVLTKGEGLEEKLKAFFLEVEDTCRGISLPIRVGIYEDKRGDVSVSTACDRAKMACDTDRNIYRSRWVYFDEEMLNQSLGKEYILSHLNEALEKGWILDYYQPIIRAATGKVCDEEALARWKDPENGMLRPDQFIPVLEDAGLLYRLDLYMVDRIIAHLQRKKELGMPLLPVSVNLSERDFAACDMVRIITEKLDRAGIARNLLVIEITERSIGRDPELLRKVMDEFHERGYQIWLDDFGSDYSSLNVLQEYRFELIKLDMKFLRRFDKNSMSRLIIRGILDVANKAGMETLTEGVETAEHESFLKEAGCVKLQGFLYSRPVPEKELFDLYGKGSHLVPEDTSEQA